MKKLVQHKDKKQFILIRRVVGKSMWPILDPEQVVVAVRKRKYVPEDVVIVLHDGREKIKRIRAVEHTKYDVRGDNPSQSTDSRHFGLVRKDNVLGKVVWPRV